MFHAMEDCGAGMAIRQAAEVHGVPRQTLADRLSGQLTHGCCSGPPTLHAPEVENYLVQYCIYCTSHGFPFTRQRLMKYAVHSTSPQGMSTSSKTSAASSRVIDMLCLTLLLSQLQHRKAPPATSVTPTMAPPSEDTTCCARCGERDPPASSPQECESEVPWVCFDTGSTAGVCSGIEVAVELDFYCDFCDNIGTEVEI